MIPRAIVLDLETCAIPDAGTYVEPVSAPSNYKDPEKIAAYEKAETQKVIDRCALDFDLCRIVALGYLADTSSQPLVLLCRDEQEERESLRLFFDYWRVIGGTLVGFNILGFDAKVLLRRALYLGVSHPTISVDRYRHPQLEDLMLRLCYDDIKKAHSLRFYTQRFKLPPVDDDVDGSDIAALVRDGKWSNVQRHCEADLLRTKYLAQRLGVFPVHDEEEAIV